VRNGTNNLTHDQEVQRTVEQRERSALSEAVERSAAREPAASLDVRG
jgi:hypothetical protein